MSAYVSFAGAIVDNVLTRSFEYAARGASIQCAHHGVREKMAHPNVDLLRNMDQAMARGDMEEMFAAFTPDVVVHMGGASKLSGEYHDIDQLQQMFGRFMEASGEYSFENHAYLADDDHGVILQRGTMRRDGQTFATNEVFVFHFRDGKLSEFWYVPEDQSGLDAWWGK